MTSQKTVLITGGSGLIGTELSHLLIAKGFTVRWLTRSIRTQITGIEQYIWDITKGTIDKRALIGVDTIIHLAGSNIAEKKWTKARKQDIIDSRCQPLQLIEKHIHELTVKPTCVISASATGIYPGHDFKARLNESANKGSSFTAQVCQQWEAALEPFRKAGIRTASIRTGIVLSHKGGAMPRLIQLSKMRIASPIGSGQQSFAWIHIKDLCSIFQFVIENTQLHGAINAVAPQATSNAEFMAALAKALNKQQIMPSIPAFVVRTLWGERSQMLLEGSIIIPQQLLDHAFTFGYANCQAAFAEILSQH